MSRVLLRRSDVEKPRLAGPDDSICVTQPATENMSTIRFPLDEVGLSELLVEFLNSNIEEVTPALRFSHADKNDRIEIGDISVEEVRVLETGLIEVDYQYEWSFFAGCKDINDEGVETETIRGRLVGGYLEFDAQERTETRSTFDEL